MSIKSIFHLSADRQNKSVAEQNKQTKAESICIIKKLKDHKWNDELRYKSIRNSGAYHSDESRVFIMIDHCSEEINWSYRYRGGGEWVVTYRTRSGV